MNNPFKKRRTDREWIRQLNVMHEAACGFVAILLSESNDAALNRFRADLNQVQGEDVSEYHKRLQVYVNKMTDRRERKAILAVLNVFSDVVSKKKNAIQPDQAYVNNTQAKLLYQYLRALRKLMPAVRGETPEINNALNRALKDEIPTLSELKKKRGMERSQFESIYQKLIDNREFGSRVNWDINRYAATVISKNLPTRAYSSRAQTTVVNGSSVQRALERPDYRSTPGRAVSGAPSSSVYTPVPSPREASTPTHSSNYVDRATFEGISAGTPASTAYTTPPSDAYTLAPAPPSGEPTKSKSTTPTPSHYGMLVTGAPSPYRTPGGTPVGGAGPGSEHSPAPPTGAPPSSHYITPGETPVRGAGSEHSGGRTVFEGVGSGLEHSPAPPIIGSYPPPAGDDMELDTSDADSATSALEVPDFRKVFSGYDALGDILKVMENLRDGGVLNQWQTTGILRMLNEDCRVDFRRYTPEQLDNVVGQIEGVMRELEAKAAQQSKTHESSVQILNELSKSTNSTNPTSGAAPVSATPAAGHVNQGSVVTGGMWGGASPSSAPGGAPAHGMFQRPSSPPSPASSPPSPAPRGSRSK